MRDWLKVLNHYGDYDIQDMGDTLRLSCPIHRSSNTSSFVIHKDNLLWYCHSTCGEGGDLIKFVMRMENLNFKNGKMKLEWILNRDITAHADKSKIVQDAELFIKSTKTETSDVLEYDMPDVEYIPLTEFRGMKRETIQHFGITYAKVYPITNKQGEHINLYNRIIFPIIYRNKTVGASLRRTQPGTAKWFHVPRGINMGDILYNYDNIEPFNDVYVVEGITDVLKLYDVGVTNVVCTFGANLTKHQENLLLQVAETIILCYDGDKAGKSGMDKINKSMKHKVNLFYVDLEKGDPCDYSNEELLQVLENRRRFNE